MTRQLYNVDDADKADASLPAIFQTPSCAEKHWPAV